MSSSKTKRDQPIPGKRDSKHQSKTEEINFNALLISKDIESRIDINGEKQLLNNGGLRSTDEEKLSDISFDLYCLNFLKFRLIPDLVNQRKSTGYICSEDSR